MTPTTADLALVRGDTFAIGVNVTGSEAEPDAIYFSVKRRRTETGYILQKSLDDGITPEESEDEDTYRYRIDIDPADTETLLAGAYVYDVEVTWGGSVHTLITGTLTIAADVTRHTE